MTPRAKTTGEEKDDSQSKTTGEEKDDSQSKDDK
jgi:hypothetical protein